MCRKFTFFLFLMVLLITAGQTAYAQNPIAQLKFEDAERAFNAGEFSKALKYVEDTEALVGVTTRTLYLKIVSQDALLQKDAYDHLDLLSDLKVNATRYLEFLKNEAIDERYRTVYRISEKIKDYPKGSDKLGAYTASTNAATSDHQFRAENAAVQQILTDYKTRLLEQGDLSGFTTLVTTAKLSGAGSLFSSFVDKKAVNKHWFNAVGLGGEQTLLVYHNNKGYIRSAQLDIPMDEAALAQQQLVVQSKFAILTVSGIDTVDFSNASLATGTLNSQKVNVIKKGKLSFYFDPNSKLLIAERISGSGDDFHVNNYQDYRLIDGFYFPFTIISESRVAIAKKNAQKMITEMSVGLLKKRARKSQGSAQVNALQNFVKQVDSGSTIASQIKTKVSSIQINEEFNEAELK